VTPSSLSNLGIKINPIWIVLFYQLNLPGARPLLQPLLTPNSVFNLVEAFEINEAIDIVTVGKAFGIARLVFVHTANEVIGYADVKRTANAIGQYVDVEAPCSHRPSLEYLGRPVKPGDDSIIPFVRIC
jgi:hypothetical protein